MLFPGGTGSRLADKLNILVVDDDPLILRMFKDYLGHTFQVFTARNGEEALGLLEQQKVAAILSDQMMPEMTGVELLEASLQLQPEAVRVLVTAGDRLENLQEAVNVARIHRFLVKPVRLLELSGAVEGALREAELARENARLLKELKEKNQELEKALEAVRDHEQRLEQEVDVRTKDLADAVARLSELALRDGLTGLYNHRFFQEALTSEMARASRYGRQLGFLFIDVDNFKNFNDSLGHQAGDELLKELGRLLLSAEERPGLPRGRASDIAARYGGEEFVLILPETDRQGSLVRAERLRASVESHLFPGREAQPGGRVTVSIGVASYPEDCSARQELIMVADQALLRAKRTGKNRVCSSAS